MHDSGDFRASLVLASVSESVTRVLEALVEVPPLKKDAGEVAQIFQERVDLLQELLRDWGPDLVQDDAELAEKAFGEFKKQSNVWMPKFGLKKEEEEPRMRALGEELVVFRVFRRSIILGGSTSCGVIFLFDKSPETYGGQEDVYGGLLSWAAGMPRPDVELYIALHELLHAFDRASARGVRPLVSEGSISARVFLNRGVEFRVAGHWVEGGLFFDWVVYQHQVMSPYVFSLFVADVPQKKPPEVGGKMMEWFG
jgi:hypothetical protein